MYNIVSLNSNKNVIQLKKNVKLLSFMDHFQTFNLLNSFKFLFIYFLPKIHLNFCAPVMIWDTMNKCCSSSGESCQSSENI